MKRLICRCQGGHRLTGVPSSSWAVAAAKPPQTERRPPPTAPTGPVNVLRTCAGAKEAGGADPWTAEAARIAYEESQLLAAEARAFAVAAYSRAADAHRTAALAAEARGDLVRAQEHRKLAVADDSRAAALAQVLT
jgi:hypothetical protein